MIHEVIKKIKENILSNSEVVKLYNDYSRKKKIEEELQETLKQVEELENQLKQQSENLKNFNFIKKLINRKSYNSLKKNVQELYSKIKTLTNNVENLEISNSNVVFNEEQLETIYKYVKSLDLENLAVNNKSEELISNLIEFFDFDFKKFVQFCNDNNIFLDFTGDLEIQFLDIFAVLKNNVRDLSNTVYSELQKKYMDYMRLTNNDSNNKISSLSDIVLVRKLNALPENDVLMTGGKAGLRKVNKDLYFEGYGYKEYEVVVPIGRCTTHWMMNQEVLPHIDAPNGWQNCDNIIMQPMNERLYNSALGLNPVDTFFLNEVPLEDYYIVCSSFEEAEKAKIKNPKATIFVFSKEMINGAANKLLRASGIKCYYRDYAGGNLDGTFDYVGAFSKELLDKYPDLVTRLGRGPGNFWHELQDNINEICWNDAIIDTHISLLNPEETLDNSITKINNSARKGLIYLKLNRYNINLSDYFVFPNDDLRIFCEKIADLNIKNFQDAFDIIINGIEITEQNKDAVLRIKEMAIQKYVSLGLYENSYSTNEEHEKFLNYMFTLRKTVTSELINRNIDKNISYDVPLEFYDYSAVETMCENLILSNQNPIELSESNDINSLITLPISKPSDCYANDLVKEAVRISRISDYTKIDEQIKMFTNKMGLIPDFEHSIRDIINSINNSDKNINREIIRLIAIGKSYGIDSKVFSDENKIEKQIKKSS